MSRGCGDPTVLRSDDARAGRRTHPVAALAVAGSTAALMVCAPSPPAAVAALRLALDNPSPAAGALMADLAAPLVAGLSLVGWALTTWLAVAAALTGASRVPGAVGRASASVVRRIAPHTVRQALELALGLTVAVAWAGPASASSAGAGAGPLPAGAVATSGAVAPLLDWPTTPRPALPRADRGQVVVAPGDTLWALSADALGPDATPAQIADAWPAWWSANRDVIGSDPDLLHPGQRLTPPR